MPLMTDEEFAKVAEKILGPEKKIPKVNDLMPIKDYYDQSEFLSWLGDLAKYPYERQPCGCMYVKAKATDGTETWIYISLCTKHTIEELINQHRHIYGRKS